MTELQSYLTLSDAARKYGFSSDVLTRLARDGIIRAVRANGDVLVAEQDLVKAVQREDFRALEDRPIHLSKAARKYELPRGSLSRWATAGYIKVLGRDRNRRLLNEADVAYIRALIDAAGGPRPGRSLARILTLE